MCLPAANCIMQVCTAIESFVTLESRLALVGCELPLLDSWRLPELMYRVVETIRWVLVYATF